MASDDFAVQMKNILNEYSREIDEVVEESFQESSKQTVKVLRSTSPKRPGGGDYARSWTQKKLSDKEFLVYNKDHWQLTHLLNNGHIIKNKYGEYGRVPGDDHIAKAEEQAQDDVLIRISRGLQ